MATSPYAWTPEALRAPPAATSLSPPANSRIFVGEHGRIHGVDGMLDQIAGALMKHAGPMIRREVLPAVREDAQLQTRVGQAVGQAVASELAPWIVLGAAALGVMAVIQVSRWHSDRSARAAPASRRRR